MKTNIKSFQRISSLLKIHMTSSSFPKQPQPPPNGPNPNIKTYYPYLNLLKKCATIRDLHKIHAHIITLGLAHFSFITSRILSFYAHRDINTAHQLFDTIPQHPTTYNYNTIIMGFAKCPDHSQMGLSFYSRMRSQDTLPNMHTFPCLIKCCHSSTSSMSGVHAHVYKFGFDRDVFVTSSLIMGYCGLRDLESARRVFDENPEKNVVCWSSLISGYSGCGLVNEAREVFDKMPERNDVSWTAMISGYVKNERCEDGIWLFRELRGQVGMKQLNRALLVCVLSGCAAAGDFEEGKWVHSYIDSNGLEYGVEIGTALVDFYAKCGFIDSARQVFDKMPRKDLTAWSAMIMGYALNGHSQSAIDTFSQMVASKVKPNAITFVGLLVACNHGGLVDEGRAYFVDMRQKYHIAPTIEHYGCIVDLLSRASFLEEVDELIHSMPMEPDAAIWGSVLNGCLLHGNVELGERAGRRVMEMEPWHFGRYVGLANVYAKMRKWESVAEVRRAMRERGVRTTPGWSLIQVDGVGHRFVADDKRHPQLGEINEMLALVSSSFETLII